MSYGYMQLPVMGRPSDSPTAAPPVIGHVSMNFCMDCGAFVFDGQQITHTNWHNRFDIVGSNTNTLARDLLRVQQDMNTLKKEYPY